MVVEIEGESGTGQNRPREAFLTFFFFFLKGISRFDARLLVSLI
jgi:hypothetical protein